LKFVQMIEFQTARVDDVLALEEQWRAANGQRSGMALRIAKDLDRHDRYVWIVEFPSYEVAMRSDVLQEIERVAEKLAELADGPAVFHNLDVMRQPLP
jgi:hypothetical protein